MKFMIGLLKEHLGFEHYYEKSLTVAGNTYLFMGRKKPGEKALVAAVDRKADRKIFDRFGGEESAHEDYLVKVCPLTAANAAALRRTCEFTGPVPGGTRCGFGFGDRLGNATPGHARAAKGFQVFPFFAQQSAREMARTGETPAGVIDNATWGVFQENYSRGYGADADHLKTREDVRAASEAGFTMFTIDPSDHIGPGADDMEKEELDKAFGALFEDRREEEKLMEYYLSLSLEKLGVTFSYADVKREAVKYLPAARHIIDLYNYLLELRGDQSFDFEVSVDETEMPTTEKSHLFMITRLAENGVRVTGLAPRFPGEFQKGVDYRGDIKEFREALKKHRLIAMEYGNYKISIHSGSDKFSIFPEVGRLTHKKFHEKTAGTSYIEAIRIVARKSPALYKEIHGLALERFEADRHSYHVTTDLSKIPLLEDVPESAFEELLDGDDCRQLIHITYGSVLAEKDGKGGRGLRDRIIEILDEHEEEYYETLSGHFLRHLRGFGLK